MTPLNNAILLTCFGLSFAFVLFELIVTRNTRGFLLEGFLLLLAGVLLNLTTGFPTAPTVAFGGGSPLFVVLILFIFVVFGIISNYFFHLKKKFKWQSFAKPLLISPIVLVPLLGAVNFEELKLIQLISLLFLAYQNGFFWKEIFNKAGKVQA